MLARSAKELAMRSGHLQHVYPSLPTCLGITGGASSIPVAPAKPEHPAQRDLITQRIPYEQLPVAQFPLSPLPQTVSDGLKPVLLTGVSQFEFLRVPAEIAGSLGTLSGSERKHTEFKRERIASHRAKNQAVIAKFRAHGEAENRRRAGAGDALIARANRIEACCTAPSFFGFAPGGEVTFQPRRCKDRCCSICRDEIGHRRARDFQALLSDVLRPATERLLFGTLTFRRRKTDSLETLRELQEAIWLDFAESRAWRDFKAEFLKVIEIEREPGRPWNVHVHFVLLISGSAKVSALSIAKITRRLRSAWVSAARKNGRKARIVSLKPIRAGDELRATAAKIANYCHKGSLRARKKGQAELHELDSNGLTEYADAAKGWRLLSISKGWQKWLKDRRKAAVEKMEREGIARVSWRDMFAACNAACQGREIPAKAKSWASFAGRAVVMLYKWGMKREATILLEAIPALCRETGAVPFVSSNAPVPSAA